MGRSIRGHEALVKHTPAIQPICESLKQSTGYRVSVINLPKTRRATAVFLFVIMMERPDAVTGRFQNGASNNAKAEFEQEIQFVGFDLLDVLRLEILAPFSFKFRLALHALDAGQAFIQGLNPVGGNVRNREKLRLHIPEVAIQSKTLA